MLVTRQLTVAINFRSMKKIWLHFHFWMNYSFNVSLMSILSLFTHPHMEAYSKGNPCSSGFIFYNADFVSRNSETPFFIAIFWNLRIQIFLLRIASLDLVILKEFFTKLQE